MHKGNTRRKSKRTKEILKIIKPENFPKLISETKLQFQEAQIIPSRIHAKTKNQNQTKTDKKYLRELGISFLNNKRSIRNK